MRTLIRPQLFPAFFIALCAVLPSAPLFAQNAQDKGAIEPNFGPYKIAVLAYKGKKEAAARWAGHGVYLTQQLAPLKFEVIPLTYAQNELTQAVIERQVDFVITNPGHYTELELNGYVSRLATRRVAGRQGILDQFGGAVITRIWSSPILQAFVSMKGTGCFRISGLFMKRLSSSGLDENARISSLSAQRLYQPPG